MCRSLWFCMLSLLSLGTFAGELNAQTAVTTSGGTSSTIPVFTGTSTLGNSPIFATSGGFVGIGTSGPAYPLDVSGDINFSGVLRYQGSPFINLQNQNFYFVDGGGNPSTTPCCNIAIGWYSFANNSAGTENVAIGRNALSQNTTANYNTAIGTYTLSNNTTAQYNTALGHHAMQYNVTGVDNTALGAGALFMQQRGDASVAIGINTLYYAGNPTQSGIASNNVGVGGSALVNLLSGYDNAALGDGAGDDISTGVNTSAYQGTYIGASTAGLASGDWNETVIGAYAVGHGSNTVTLGNSSVIQTFLNGNVGIGTGTTAPAATLDVNGTVRVTSLGANNPNPICTGANGILTTTGCSSSSSSGTPILTQTSGSSGTSNIQISGGLNTTGPIVANGQVVSIGPGAGFRVLGGEGDDVNGAPWYGVGESTLNLWPGAQNAVQVAGYFGLDFETSTGTMVMRGDSGFIGLNTTTPESMLEVNGNITLTANSGASMTFQDGTVQATAWNGTTLGGDYAESVDVLGDRSKYEPGDVIVIDPGSAGRFAKSSEPYSKLVAGVYSTQPGLVGRRTTADRPNKDAEVPMAMMGIVPVKVSTENGAIEIGDLLVSSNMPGYAMKGTEAEKMLGTVIGKALRSYR